MRATFALSYFLALIGCTSIFVIHTKLVKQEQLGLVAADKAAAQAAVKAFESIIPYFLLLAKFGVNMAFLATYQSSYNPIPVPGAADSFGQGIPAEG